MRNLALLLLLSLMAGGAAAQSAPGGWLPYEIYAQASAIGSDALNGDFTKFNGPAPGFRLGGALHTRHRIGLAADLGHYRFSDHTGRTSMTTFMMGPRLSTLERFRSSWFVQPLFGAALWSVDSAPQRFTHTKFICSLGGGLDIRLTRQFALRPVELEFVLASTGHQLLDARLSSGLVYRFGGR